MFAHDKTLDSIYEEIALLRFPNYKISGIGNVAVVLECSGRVVLCSFPMEAQSLAAESCGPLCNHPDKFHSWHHVEKLDVPKQEIHQQRHAYWDR